MSPPRLPSLASRLVEITVTYFPFGYITFGGPNAHVALLHERLVINKRWLDDQTFSEIFSICQALPGPASTELAYSIALVRAGFIPAMWGFLLWSIPGFIVMTGAGIGISYITSSVPIWALRLEQGLSAAAVGLVALAGFRLGSSIAKDRLTKILLLISAGLAICYEAPWLYPVLMIFGGTVSYVFDTFVAWKTGKAAAKVKKEGGDRENDVKEANTATTSESEVKQLPEEDAQLKRRAAANATDNAADEEKALEDEKEKPTAYRPMYTYSKKIGFAFLLAFLLLLILAIIGRSAPVNLPTELLSIFYIVGSIIFGGGPVVIPLLRGYTVPPGWLTDREFLIGLALIQALPGPNFNFAVYVGALALRGPNGQGVAGAFLAFVGIFLPGLLLKNAVVPFWQWIRDKPFMKKVFRGVNACAVGLVFAAIWLLWTQISIGVPTGLDSHEGFHIVVAAIAFVAAAYLKVPAPAIIVIGGVLGVLEWAATDLPQGH
ncbi:putative chromate ion transporter [Jimgerdemannia flammicorona]|uniref:Putative chromate ion transporter n=1 Tax=Jimgerdemannia flammicorona TaxID=994334 RepID=A0A433D0K1_9FUNG|nr:putative chromate ion transporter [Jimgerdemannia flammicorona]